MVGGIKRAVNGVIDHYLAVCLFLSLFTMTIIGVGSIVIVGQLGLVLCVAGFLQKSAKADLRVLCPLLIYHIISLISGYAAFHRLVPGYPATQFFRSSTSCWPVWTMEAGFCCGGCALRGRG